MNRILFRLPVLALLCLLLAGCITRGPGDWDRASGAESPPPETTEYRPAATPLGHEEVVSDEYFIQWMLFGGETDSGPLPALRARHYRGNHPGPRPLVILVPVWGDGMYAFPSSSLQRHIVRRAEGAIDVLEIAGGARLIRWDELGQVPDPESFIERLDETVERYRRSALTIRGMLDWAQRHPELDGSRVAIVGFSVGALAAANVLGTDERFRSGVLVMGPAELGAVLATCGGRTGEVRDQVLDRLDWSLEEYEAQVGEILAPADPAHGDFHFDPQRLLIMDAMLDRCIPRKGRRALWETTGRPKRISFIASHRQAFLSQSILGLHFGNRRIYRSLREHLLE
ncbi:MAG: hypothetical protein ACNA7E_10775, partial [Wenzhouxiangellaceae bacterium]